jgi:hypothetical protein
MAITPYSALEQRLEAAEVLIQFGSRIGTQQLRYGLTGTTDRWVVAEPEVYPGTVGFRTKADNSRIVQH